METHDEKPIDIMLELPFHSNLNENIDETIDIPLNTNSEQNFPMFVQSNIPTDNHSSEQQENHLNFFQFSSVSEDQIDQQPVFSFVESNPSTEDDQQSNVMLNQAYENEINYVQRALDFNILLMGAPRIGKSQLTNALTGNCLRQAKTKHSNSTEQSKVYIWDTKGIENWTEQESIGEMFQIIDHIQPIAVIYCAAPGTFANLSQVKVILNYCFYKKIFCAAVITNMWASSREARMSAKADLENLLEGFGPRKILEFETDDPILRKHEVTMFGENALCTMVNSTPFGNPDLSPIIKPIRGIDELTHCIMQSLSEHAVRGWAQAVLDNRSYWNKVHQQMQGYVLVKYSELSLLAKELQNNLQQGTSNILYRLFTLFSQ
ncbi:hypothetical protein I4U23_005790 [Adineta vaga]|nr:hypothetical protein I4U23_005790 [Adineta vaga]